jgi:hypothetical protein
MIFTSIIVTTISNDNSHGSTPSTYRFPASLPPDKVSNAKVSYEESNQVSHVGMGGTRGMRGMIVSNDLFSPATR